MKKRVTTIISLTILFLLIFSVATGVFIKNSDTGIKLIEGKTVEQQLSVVIVNGSDPTWILENPQVDDNNAGLGSSVTSGDVNNDGIDDIISGAPHASIFKECISGATTDYDYSGRVYVWFGSTSTVSSEPDITLEDPEDIEKSKDPSCNRQDIGNRLGTSVASGDINNDGIGDIIAGAFTGQKVYVWFGSTSNISGSEPDITLGGTLQYLKSQLGHSVASGDVNNDGIDDIIAGAPQSSRVYVWFGSSSSVSSEPDVTLEEPLYDYDPSPDYDPPSSLGHSVASGDINSDGIDDIIAGAVYADKVGTDEVEYGASGRVYVWFGSTSDINGSEPDITLENPQDDDSRLGTSVSSGDINNDGIDDIISGAYKADKSNYDDTGKVYVWFGSTSTVNSEPDIIMENIKDDDDMFSRSVSSGDINNDDIGDIVAGAYNAEFGGRVYAWFGSTSTVNSEPDITLEREKDWPINDCSNNNCELGYSVASGDVDGDGISDIIAGAKRSNGRVYVWTTRKFICSDGTEYGKCSSTKPKYCDNGNLVDDCIVCGCDANQECQENGSCEQASFPVVNIISPSNVSQYFSCNDEEYLEIPFFYNFTESNYQNTTLIIDDFDNVTVTDGISGSAQQNITTNLTSGSYNWSIRITDKSNNQKTSEVRYHLCVLFVGGSCRGSSGCAGGPIEITPPTPSPGSGGGGGGRRWVSETEQVESVSLATGGKAGETKTVTFSKDIGVTEIDLTFQNRVSKATVTVEKLDTKPAETTTPEGTVHSYLKIDKDLEDEDLGKAKIKFKVKRIWLATNGVLAEEIGLIKYDKGWEKLPTKKVDRDKTYVYYEAETEGFSYFAIIAEKKPAPVIFPEVKEEEEETIVLTEEEIEKYEKSSSWLIVSLSAIVLLLLVSFIFIRKRFQKVEKLLERKDKKINRLRIKLGKINSKLEKAESEWKKKRLLKRKERLIRRIRKWESLQIS